MTQEPTQRQQLLAASRKAASARNFAQAALTLEKLLEGNPNDTDALDMLGFVRFFEGRFEDSKACCERVLALKPDHAYAHKGLGLNLARLGRLDEGILHLQQAMELRPAWPDPCHDLAVVLAEHGRLEQAIAVLDEWIQAHSEPTEMIKVLRHKLGQRV